MSAATPGTAGAEGAEALRQRYLEARPMWRIVLGQFVEHRMAVAGLVVIAFFLAVALLAPVISAVTGLEPDRQNVRGTLPSTGVVGSCVQLPARTCRGPVPAGR